MQLVYSSIAPFLIVSCLIWISSSPVYSYSDGNSEGNSADESSNGILESTDSGGSETSSTSPSQITPSSSSKPSQSTFFVTATQIGMPKYVYPSESPMSPAITPHTHVTSMDQDNAQPDFSPEQTDEEMTERDASEQNAQEFQAQRITENTDPTSIPMEETTFQAINDESVPTYMENNIPDVSSNEISGDVGSSDVEFENETELPEPLPTPMALITSDGEGSNPPLEEEFAEAFKIVGPSGRKRRVRPGNGRKRVRMRVRKLKNLPSTDNPQNDEVFYTTLGYNNEEDGTVTPDTSSTTDRPRRYRSTTPSPDPSPPTMSQMETTATSTVKNGPKPIIISDIHSGSTGLNTVTLEPQLEKPNQGGFTEKISTYFITPPTRISTTKAPKIISNDSKENIFDISKAIGGGESLVKGTNSPFEGFKNPWDKNAIHYRSSTESTDRSNSLHSSSPNSADVENSIQQPTMEDRTFSVNKQGAAHQPEYEAGNNFVATVTPVSHETDKSSNNLFRPFPFPQANPTVDAQPSGSTFFTNPQYFQEGNSNAPFDSNGQGRQMSASHYDRTKDAFLSATRFFNENSPFAQNQAESEKQTSQPPPEHSEPEHGPTPNQINETPLPVFDQNGFISTSVPVIDHHHYYMPNGQEIAVEHFESHRENSPPTQNNNNDFSKGSHYDGTRFKSSPLDPVTKSRETNSPYNIQPEKPTLIYPENSYPYNNEVIPNSFSQEGPPPSPHYSPPMNTPATGYDGSQNGGPPPSHVEYAQNLDGPHIPHIEYPQNVQNSQLSPSGEYIQNQIPPSTQTEYSQALNQNLDAYSPQTNQNPNAYSPQILNQNPILYTQTSAYNDISNSIQSPPSSAQIYGTVENVPAYNNINNNNNNNNNIDPSGNSPTDENGQRYPIFIASSPGEPSRSPAYNHLPPRPPMRPYRMPSFFRSMQPPINGPEHHPHGPRYPPPPMRHPLPNNSPFNPNNHMGNHPQIPSGRPPPNFQNLSPHVNIPMPGNIPAPPIINEEQALSEAQTTHHFPPHTHSMSDKPDYEPANPPLPHGHPLEQQHFESGFSNHIPNGPENHQENQVDNFQDSGPGPQLESPSGNSHYTEPTVIHHEPEQNHNRPGYDIVSAYYDKPPPTVSSDYGHDSHSPPSVHDVKNNELYNVPYQYTNSDGGGLDGGPFFHKPQESSPKKPEYKPSESSSSKHPHDEDGESSPPHHESGNNEERKNKSSVYSDTPYVLMFPQLVPDEALAPPPPKMMTKEIPVVQASSLSSMSFTPDGKPVLGPGLKAVPVHPRHQMYQVLAKAHYEKAMQKYLESRKKPPSAIYTPYGVLVPMGTHASASTNHETFVKSHFPSPHRKTPKDKQLLNLLLRKNKSPYFQLQKETTSKNGHLNKFVDLKANVDPALDLLAEKLAIKLSAVKYVLSAPAKLGAHAFAKSKAKHNIGSYSEHKPVTVENDKGEESMMSSLGTENVEVVSKKKEAKKKGRSDEVIDPELKKHLKNLLKERLKEVLEEAEAESHEHEPSSSSSSRAASSSFQMPMMQSSSSSNVISAQLPTPNYGAKWPSYFLQSKQPVGGLIGTIKRLFSFGSSQTERSDSNNGFPTFGGSITNSNTSSHPFGWYGGIGRLGKPADENVGGNRLGENPSEGSVGRMGQPDLGDVDKQREPEGGGTGRLGESEMRSESGKHAHGKQVNKSEKKVKKQLEKWLDIVLRSSDTSKPQPSLFLEKFPMMSDKGKKGKLFGLDDSSSSLLSSSSSSSSVKSGSSSKSTVQSSSSSSSLSNNSNNLSKRLGLTGGSNLLSTSWKPMVSAFRSVFNYSPKKPTVLKPKSV